MTKWNILDIVKAVDGKLINPPKKEQFIKGFQQDSRKIKEDFIFIPLIADRNGHDFVGKAKEKGAIASFWSDSLDDAPEDLPLIVVENTLKALQEVAVYHLKRVDPKVIAITGSNGKTTSKDMVNKVLEAKYSTHKTAGNYNNDIGLPLTILEMEPSTEMLILEMGTSNPGEIEFLSKLAQPDLAVVTMIGESHIESFGSREDLAKEKLSIRSALKKEGLFIYPANEPLIKERLFSDRRNKNFSITQSADLYAEKIIERRDLTEFTLVDKETKKKMRMEIPIPGSYNVNNALIALLVGLEFGVSLKKAKKQLSQLKITKNRLEWVDGVNNWSILNDAYNASPSSMRAVLGYFEKLKTKSDKVLVLGDILELGEFSESLHRGLADAIHLNSYASIFLYGVEMKALYKEIKKEKNSEKVYYFEESKEDLVRAIKDEVKESSYLLFKSSNGTDLLSLVHEFMIDDK